MVDVIPLLLFAYGAGLIASFNPCGFVILPAILSQYFFKKSKKEKLYKRIFDGTSIGVKIVAGFLSVFMVIGVVISYISSAFAVYVPWITLALAVVLIAFGILTLANRQISLNLPIQLPLNTSKTVSFYNYGMLYGFTSFGCTLPIFIAVVAGAFASAGFLEGLLTFLFYTLGMGTILIAVTIAIATSKNIFVKHLMKVLPHSKKINAIVLLLVGVYLIYRVQTLYFV